MRKIFLISILATTLLVIPSTLGSQAFSPAYSNYYLFHPLLGIGGRGPSSASWQTGRDYWFLDTAVNVGTNTTLNYGANLPSRARDVSKYSSGSLTVIFSRAAGTTDTVNVEIWCSPNGSVWSLLRQSAGETLLQVQTDTDAITGNVVRVTYLINLPGIRYLRLGSVFNSDTVNAITGFNVLLSLGSI